MKKIKENAGWVLILFIVISAGSLYFFPHSTPLKAALLFVSILTGLMSGPFQSRPDQEIIQDEHIFYLKSKKLSLSEIAQVVIPLSFFVLLREHTLSLVILMVAIMRGMQLLIEFAYVSEYSKPYLYLGNDIIKRQVPGTAGVNLKSLKYVVLRPGRLILYEKWAHHKIVFSEFEEGERLKETLLARITALKIELREEPAVGAS